MSKANVYELCGLQAYKKYEQKLKEGAKSDSSRVGVVLHELQEAELRNNGQDLDTLLAIREEQYKLTTNEMRDIRIRFSSLITYSIRIKEFKEKAKVSMELLEKQLAIDEQFKAVDFFDPNALMRGVVDHGMLAGDGILYIVDHKSGKKKPITEHFTQFFLYMIFGIAAYPQVRGVQCGINYMDGEKVQWAPRRDGTPGFYTRAEIEGLHSWLATYLNKNIAKLQMFDEENRADPETGWQCEFCGYVTDCGAGQAEVEKRKAKRSSKKTPSEPNL